MNRLKQHHKTCEICQCKFWSHRSDAKTCSETCKKRRQRGTEYAYVKGPMGPHTLKKLPPAPSQAQVPATRSATPGTKRRRDVPATKSAKPGTKRRRDVPATKSAKPGTNTNARAAKLEKLYPHDHEVFCDLGKGGPKPGKVDRVWGRHNMDRQPGLNMVPVNLGFEWRWLYPTKNGGWCMLRKSDAW